MRTSTHCAIVTCDVCIRHQLRKHRAESRRAKRRVATGRKLELLTKENKEFGALFGCGECEKLGDLKCRCAERARTVDKGRVDEKTSDLSYCVFEDKRVRGAWWERMGVLQIDLRRDGEGDVL